MFREVEAVASAVCSMAYRSAICSMLAFRVFVIEKGVVGKEWATQNMNVVNKVKPENKIRGYFAPETKCRV